MSPAQAIRLFLNQVADTNAIPLSFDYQSKLSVKTIAAIAELENDKGIRYNRFDDFISELQDSLDEVN